jgi:CheY-like chemotaxis protein
VRIPYAIGSPEDIHDHSRDRIIITHRDSLKNMNILLVEDNDINRLYATSILKNWECKVDMAENGYVAVEKIKDNNFDIVLMDIQMPVMDGFEATKAIRLGDAPGNDIPIIALTANATRKDIEKCLAAGMNDCIPKPFTPEDLFRMLFKYSNYSRGSRRVATPKIVEPLPVPVDQKSTPSSDLEDIDLSYLRKVSGGNDGFVHDMINTFIETMPAAIKEIRDNAALKHWDNVAKSVHKIKPSLTMMGLTKTRDTGAFIEESAKERTSMDVLPSTVMQFCDQLEFALNQLRKIG